MTLASFLLQLLNGLSGASALFLVAAGLTLIFGVTRIVNFAHGSLYMLGAYGAYAAGNALASIAGRGALAFWLGAAFAVPGVLWLVMNARWKAAVHLEAPSQTHSGEEEMLEGRIG